MMPPNNPFPILFKFLARVAVVIIVSLVILRLMGWEVW